MKLLFVTPHMGGGVGRAISGIGELLQRRDHEVSVLLLEMPQKFSAVMEALACGITLRMLRADETVSAFEGIVEQKRSAPYETESLEGYLAMQDVVIINWWDHPLMAKFLYELPKNPMRLVCWHHNNGCHYPYLDYEFMKAFDRNLFTSTYSYENPLLSDHERREIMKSSAVIYGCGNFVPQEITPARKQHASDRFVVGYAGTLHYAKLHPAFMQYCEAAMQQNPHLYLVLAGDPEKKLQQQIAESPYRERFQLLGYVEDMERFWEKIDVLGYLLNPENYATTENVILEAMMHAVPVVAYAGGIERAIIRDEVDGRLVHSVQEYLAVMKQLQEDVAYRIALGRRGRQKVCAAYSGENNALQMEKQLFEVLRREPVIHDFQRILGATPFEWFLRFTGPDREKLIDPILRKQLWIEKPIYLAENKSSVYQFLRYLEDPKLRELVEQS